ncbi:hypothetical protein PanWU01x14_020240 [Parasponia andersonii]|uniref:LRR domain containing protein n=1 Tax=Parasponia andersonii TaxID=3476 RepID=A0A2P5DYP4_PARAD|nr:hypothetical protein PanWU01x14_020240 [Parasponia andersonii]
MLSTTSVTRLDFKASKFTRTEIMVFKATYIKTVGRIKGDENNRGALPLLEKLEFGPSPLMKEMSLDIQDLTNLKSLDIMGMTREFVVGLQPNHEEDGIISHYWKILHVHFVIFRYKRNRGQIYENYKAGALAETSARASQLIDDVVSK